MRAFAISIYHCIGVSMASFGATMRAYVNQEISP